MPSRSALRQPIRLISPILRIPTSRTLRVPHISRGCGSYCLSGLLILLLFAASLTAPAQSTQQAIEARLKGHPLYLRGLWPQNKLKFDATGSTRTPPGDEPFTLCGIDIRDIQMVSDGLALTGDRMGVEFMQIGPVRITLHKKIEIHIAAPPGTDYGHAFDKIFADGLADLVPSIPEIWQRFAQHAFVDPSQRQANPDEDYLFSQHPHAPGKPADPPVSQPQVIFTKEPEFTDEARQLAYNGTVRVAFIVDTDGTVKKPFIVRAIGLGLDEQAVATVRQYRFKPAMQEDKPVPTHLIVEISFHTSVGLHP